MMKCSLNASVTTILGHQIQSAEYQHNLKPHIENRTRQPATNLAELHRNNINMHCRIIANDLMQLKNSTKHIGS